MKGIIKTWACIYAFLIANIIAVSTIVHWVLHIFIRGCP